MREFDSHSVLLIFDNLVEPTKGVHGVVVTHLLAKEELRVRFSLDAFDYQGVGKSGTPRASGARDRRFKSDHPDCFETYSGGSCVGTGRRLLIAQTQFDSCCRSFTKCEVGSSKFEAFHTSSFALQTSFVPLAERQRSWTSNPVRSVRLRHGTLFEE